MTTTHWILTSLDHWDMRTGRNNGGASAVGDISLDHWDMRTGRNVRMVKPRTFPSLDHWDMRTGRNQSLRLM